MFISPAPTKAVVNQKSNQIVLTLLCSEIKRTVGAGNPQAAIALADNWRMMHKDTHAQRDRAAEMGIRDMFEKKIPEAKAKVAETGTLFEI